MGANVAYITNWLRILQKLHGVGNLIVPGLHLGADIPSYDQQIRWMY